MKIALDARVMNENIKKDKNQMPNLDGLLSILGGIITQNGKEELWFTSVGLKYAFRQVFLYLELAKRCHFTISGANLPVLSGFYRLKVLPSPKNSEENWKIF